MARTATDETDLIAALDAPYPSTRNHRYARTRPAAADLTPEVREAIHRLDLIDDRLGASRGELAAHESPQVRDAAAQADAQAVVAQATSGATIDPGANLAAWAKRAQELRAEQAALSEALAHEEAETEGLIRIQWETGIADTLKAKAQPSVAKYTKALAAMEAAEAELAPVRDLARWFVVFGMGLSARIERAPFGLDHDLEFRISDGVKVIESGNGAGLGAIVKPSVAIAALAARADAFTAMDQR